MDVEGQLETVCADITARKAVDVKITAVTKAQRAMYHKELAASFNYICFLVIRVADIRAVSGIASIIPILDERPLIVSNATKAVENK